MNPGTQIMTPPMRITRPLSSSCCRHLPQRQSFPGVGQHARSDTANDERPERAHEDQEHQRPQESNLLGHEDEGGDFRGDDDTVLTKNTPQGNPSPASAGSAPLPTPRADQEGI